MDISLRKEKRRLDFYTFKELYEFFSGFYGLSTSKDSSIGDIRKWSLYNSDKKEYKVDKSLLREEVLKELGI